MYSQNARSLNFSRENRNVLFSSIYSISSTWTNHIPHDFLDPEMIRRLEELLQLVCVEEEDRVKANELIISLKDILNRMERYENSLSRLKIKEEEELSSSDSITGLFSISSQSSIIAQQLTHIELERLSMVGLDDIILSLSMAKEDNSFGLNSSTKGVQSLIDWFNRLSSTVATEILRHSSKRHRISIIEYLIDTAKECFDMGNFNSTCAIIAGLNSSSITRLKRTQTMYSQNARSLNFSRENRNVLFSSIYSISSTWTNHIPHDFLDPEMIRRLEELLQLVCVEEEDRVKANELIISLKDILNRMERYENSLSRLKIKEEEELSSSDSITGLFSISSQSSIIAQQLTHIELERLSMVGLDDIILSLSMAKEDNSFGLNSSTKGVQSLIDWFNRLSSTVATEILRHSSKRHRISIIEYLIDTAKECFDMGNFNSTCAIIAGLNSSSITRLKRTWAKVNTSKLDILQHQLDPSGNFVSYRSTMKAALWRAEGANCDQVKIIIPFFGLLLKDLYLVYNSSPRVLPNGHINFKAYDLISSSLYPLSEWKKRTLSFPRHPNILQYLLIAPQHNERNLMLRSFQYEDPDNQSEKDLYRKLKTK